MPTPAFSTLTTMRVGGAPTRLIEPKTRDDLIAVTRAVWASGEPWLLLGGGSNTVAGEAGFDGTVIRIATRGIEHVPVDRWPAPAPAVAAATASVLPGAEAAATVRLRIQAGEPWDDVVSYTVERGWAGIEALSGIPGSTGASPVQNIGAYGQELASSLVSIEFLEHDGGEVRRLAASELGLGYRTSALKHGLLGLVLSIDLELSVGASASAGAGAGAADGNGFGVARSEPVRYPQLAASLGVGLGSRVPLAEVRRTVLRLRAAKGMVLDAADPNTASAGSFFTNPIVDDAFARSLPADAPRWPLTPADDAPLVIPLEVGQADPDAERAEASRAEAFEGRALYSAGTPSLVKLSAAWLIENSGVSRGFSLPGSAAAVSSKHTLALVNTGAATGEQIAELARFIQNRVCSEFGVVLQPEPVLVGLAL